MPEYLWGLLKARAANRLLFALAVLFVLALLLDGLVVLPKFLLERKALAVHLQRACGFCAAAPGSCLRCHYAGC